jgi:hypothetical protein
MKKIDYKKDLSHLYNPSPKEAVVVDVPEMNFLMIDGTGDPNTSEEYQEAIEALFSVSYKVKFSIKKSEAIDYAVMPLEGLWWIDDMSKFSLEDKNDWKWTAMIMQPDFVSRDLIDFAIKDIQKKKGYKLRNKHHEICLSDFRRVKPEKMKTVIRQPIQK